MSTTRKNFTLVEILVVVAIVGIMMYISLPAFEKILVGSGVELTARDMTSRIGMTRNYAISSRKYVALLMPSTGLPDQYCCMSARICIVNSSSSYDSGEQVTTYSFQRWYEGEDWNFMSLGTVISHVDNSGGYSSSEGAHEQVDGVDCSSIGASYSAVNGVRAIIFRPSGKIACDTSAYGDRYVTLGEGSYSAGAIVRKNTSNEVNIKIDKYTGRISYGTN